MSDSVSRSFQAVHFITPANGDSAIINTVRRNMLRQGFLGGTQWQDGKWLHWTFRKDARLVAPGEHIKPPYDLNFERVRFRAGEEKFNVPDSYNAKMPQEETAWEAAGSYNVQTMMAGRPNGPEPRAPRPSIRLGARKGELITRKTLQSFEPGGYDFAILVDEGVMRFGPHGHHFLSRGREAFTAGEVILYRDARTGLIEIGDLKAKTDTYRTDAWSLGRAMEALWSQDVFPRGVNFHTWDGANSVYTSP